MGQQADLQGIEFMPEPEWSYSNRWLSIVLITPQEFGADREQIRLALEDENIESRPVWKPMHMQPVFDYQESWEAGKLGGKAKEALHRCRLQGRYDR